VIPNALIATIALFVAITFWLMQELTFLIPYRSLLFHRYGSILLAWFAALFCNVFAAVLAVNRKFFLKDTGKKLSHIDKQFQVGHAEFPTPREDEEQN
jgi:hypothetical protein